VNFELKFSYFCYHGNKGLFGINYSGTIKLCDIDNPVWCNILGFISYLSRVIDNFVSKFPNFRCHGNKGRSEIYFSDIVKLPDLHNPLFGATSLLHQRGCTKEVQVLC